MKLGISILIFFLIFSLLGGVVFAQESAPIIRPDPRPDKNENIVLRAIIREEIKNSDKVILDKIQMESDLCYKNIEDTANSYFYDLREDFKSVFWTDRIVSLIGQFLAVFLAFMVSYFVMRRFELKKKVIKK